MNSSLIQIGTDKSGYANERNISALPFERYEVVRASNAFRLPNYAWFKLSGRINHYLANLHWMPGGGNCDLYHFFNGISLGHAPWVSTFETYLPRWGAYGYQAIRPGLKRLAGDPCKTLLALSENASHIQRLFLEDHPAFSAAILPKIQVLHPAQAPLFEDFTEKSWDMDHIDMCFVGADFFRKGGLEILKVIDRFLEKGAPFRLHIVSSLRGGDYASQSGSAELEHAKQLMGKHPAHIFHHHQLGNGEVLALLRRCHLALLPTWADTYGYFVLEAQAAGCPVISTNVRALPEINFPACGWVIEVERDDWGNATLDTLKDRKTIGQRIEQQLEAILQEVIDRPENLKIKGEQAFTRIRKQHSPQAKAQFLENLYDGILKRP